MKAYKTQLSFPFMDPLWKDGQGEAVQDVADWKAMLDPEEISVVDARDHDWDVPGSFVLRGRLVELNKPLPPKRHDRPMFHTLRDVRKWAHDKYGLADVVFKRTGERDTATILEPGVLWIGHDGNSHWFVRVATTASLALQKAK